MKIQKLDAYTISRIAAGEVVDRPVSVVKELIENSIDAGATKISVEIERGGLSKISVSDNGCGISPSDLSMSLDDHATSKIIKMEDLFSLASMGFRGEALASIRHVGTIDIISRCFDQKTGAKVSANHLTISPVEHAVRNQGTTVTVSDLFHNMPVRQKFLKSASTEFGYIYELLVGFIMVYPHIEFVLTHDQKSHINTIGIQSVQDRIGLIWGRDIAQNILPIEFMVSEFYVHGWITNPSFTIGNRSKTVQAVNKRMIKNPMIQKAISQAMADTIPSGRYPAIVLNIQVPTDQIDVNIHPQKRDIRFVNSGFVFDLVVKSIRSAIGQPAHGSSVAAPAAPDAQNHQFLLTETAYSSPNQIAYTDTLYRAIDWSHHQPDSDDPKSKDGDTSLPFNYLQLFDTYLVLNAGDALIVVDQHAVHERILYEDFKQKSNASTYQQPLLISQVVSLPRHQSDRLKQLLSALERLGFEVEIFGDTQFIVRQVPVSLGGPTSEATVTTLVSELSDLDTATWDQILIDKDRLQSMACKAAIKAGKRMHPLEVTHMIRALIRTPNRYTCPHGRPLVVSFYKKDLERLFHRT